jgi:hypothetical protein
MEGRLTIVTTKNFRKRLEMVAKKTGLSLSEIVRGAVIDRLDKLEK